MCTGRTAPAPPPTSTRHHLLNDFSRHVFSGHQSDPFSEMIRDISSLSFFSLQPVMLRDPCLGAGPDDGESQRRIGRSLSGTVVTSRRSRLTATRSFVSRISKALLPPSGLVLNCICLISRCHVSRIPCPCALLPLLTICLISSSSSVSNLPRCFLRLLCLSLR